MGVRKHNMAKKIKEDRKNLVFARLKACPISPRKMKFVADLVKGMAVEKALQVLKFSSREASINVEKLLLSAIASWQVKNEGLNLEHASLYIERITVDSAGMLKRLRPAPQGRGHRIRKRSNHLAIVLNSKNVQTKVNQV